MEEDELGRPLKLHGDHVSAGMRAEIFEDAMWAKLLGKSLVPFQYNMWLGGRQQRTNTPLHHDFHDNIYFLVRGQKEFRLFPPAEYTRCLPAGSVKEATLHRNGLISYGPGIREDGAVVDVAREWKVADLERRLESGEFKMSKQEEARARHELDTLQDQMLEEVLGEHVGKANRKLQKKTGKNKGGGDSPSKAVAKDHFCVKSAEEIGDFLTVKLKAGEMFFMPAGWFHEVHSWTEGHSASSEKSDVHLALNAWFHPPMSRSSLEQPYEDGFFRAWYEKQATGELAKEVEAASPTDSVDSLASETFPQLVEGDGDVARKSREENSKMADLDAVETDDEEEEEEEPEEEEVSDEEVISPAEDESSAEQEPEEEPSDDEQLEELSDDAMREFQRKRRKIDKFYLKWSRLYEYQRWTNFTKNM